MIFKIRLFLRKLFYRLLPRSVWHMRHYLYDFNITWAQKFNQNFDLVKLNSFYKIKIPNLNSEFKLFQNKVFVLASGPSLKSLKPELISHFDLVFLNGSIKLFNEIESTGQKYHFVSDPNFIVNNKNLYFNNNYLNLCYVYSVRAFYELYKLNPSFILNNNNQFRIFDQIQEPFGKPKFQTTELAKFNSNNFEYDINSDIGISFNSNIGFFDGRTVLAPCLQILKLWGYKDIHLHGVDMGGSKRFYDNKNSLSAPSYLDRDFESKILPTLNLISKHFKEHSVSVTNHTMNSRIPDNIFKKSHNYKNTASELQEKSISLGLYKPALN